MSDPYDATRPVPRPRHAAPDPHHPTSDPRHAAPDPHQAAHHATPASWNATPASWNGAVPPAHGAGMPSTGAVVPSTEAGTPWGEGAAASGVPRPGGHAPMNGRPATGSAHSPRPAADRLVAGPAHTHPRTRPATQAGGHAQGRQRGQVGQSGKAGPAEGQGIYRQEALRHRAMSRAGHMPLVISTPSFLALWVLVAAILVTGTLLTMLAVKAAS